MKYLVRNYYRYPLNYSSSLKRLDIQVVLLLPYQINNECQNKLVTIKGCHL